MMSTIFPILLGGGLGALSRYGISLLAVRLFGTRFPWGTLAVNLIGCFLIGIAFSLADRGSHLMSPTIRLFFITGFLGALTTFSTFGLETTNAFRVGNLWTAAANIAINNILGLVLVFTGMWLARIR